MSLDKRPPPVIPGNFYAAGLNYRAHIEWANRAHGTSYRIPDRADIGYRFRSRQQDPTDAQSNAIFFQIGRTFETIP